MRLLSIAHALLGLLGLCGTLRASLLPGQGTGLSNPILPGYYADPSHIEHSGVHYIYATLDPWGDRTLGCWESTNLRDWTFRELNWPTKQACTSKDSASSMVWAPSVVRINDNLFLMAVSVGSEVWIGTAPHPLGPWSNPLVDRPLVPRYYRPEYHMIDAELFIDDDGSVLMYWGSGLNWRNGRCWVVRLSEDFRSFVEDPIDVTPTHFFEAPLMVKRHGRYFLMYSDGVTIKDTYQVHYAVADSPRGPFKEGPSSPILVTDHAAQVVSPGHHTVVKFGERDFILYHRHSIPFDPKSVARQTCLDELIFRENGTIDAVRPTHTGPEFVQGRIEATAVSFGATVSASSEASPHTRASFATDANYATRWAASPEAKGGWLQIDLGRDRDFSDILIRPEFAWKPVRLGVEIASSTDAWTTLKDFTETPVTGSPIRLGVGGKARYVRVVFPESVAGKEVSLFEVAVLP